MSLIEEVLIGMGLMKGFLGIFMLGIGSFGRKRSEFVLKCLFMSVN